MIWLSLQLDTFLLWFPGLRNSLVGGMEVPWEKGDGGLLRCPWYNVPNKCEGSSWSIMGCFMAQ